MSEPAPMVRARRLPGARGVVAATGVSLTAPPGEGLAAERPNFGRRVGGLAYVPGAVLVAAAALPAATGLS